MPYFVILDMFPYNGRGNDDSKWKKKDKETKKIKELVELEDGRSNNLVHKFSVSASPFRYLPFLAVITRTTPLFRFTCPFLPFFFSSFQSIKNGLSYIFFFSLTAFNKIGIVKCFIIMWKETSGRSWEFAARFVKNSSRCNLDYSALLIHEFVDIFTFFFPVVKYFPFPAYLEFHEFPYISCPCSLF